MPENKAKSHNFAASPGQKIPNTGQKHKSSSKKQLLHYIKTPLFPVFAGLMLALLFILIRLNSNRPVTPPITPVVKESQPEISLPQAQTTLEPTVEKPVEIQLDPETKTRAIDSIKHHALVADAAINIRDQQIQPALLVSSKTPVTYAKSLGRQFAHYIKEIIPGNQPKPVFLVSVYYPDGSRIEVTNNNKVLDEEIISEMNNFE
ncbi:MAG: hypothetical protein KAG92_01865 [Deltaproteobacteria bacterium]|nr:hypothetical protein [Deltaproteobacteria bacterium]